MEKALIAFILALFHIPCQSQDSLMVGNRLIKFKAQIPFKEAMKENENVKYNALTLSTGNNEILALYLPENEIAKAKRNEAYSFIEMIKIFIPKSLYNKSASGIDLNTLKSSLIKSFTNSEDSLQAVKVKNKVKSEFLKQGVVMDLNIGTPVLLADSTIKAKSFYLILATKINLVASNKNIRTNVIQASIMTIVNDRLICAIYQRELIDNKRDYEICRNMAEKVITNLY
ncbi:hypothetical protein A4H97_33675 [Niastella yeongjuensis]|uniref:Uncharacterized protein n=1 Tax=Niastella yeongjuensis TaxID=354355 RepID=A0A1V9EDT1_9BACT|nr:hypothetical protein [Niastella yeongjuensis]OQP44124.1 hypothetical protein A4H97_33675 [Niastella yeongjuensis]SEP49220.1 hypothetical protein SAMN05660816_06914 [Niastella yeongjuensis]